MWVFKAPMLELPEPVDMFILGGRILQLTPNNHREVIAFRYGADPGMAFRRFLMSVKNSKEKMDCSQKCDSQFRDCLNSGEHESVCRMRRVPCDCSCNVS